MSKKTVQCPICDQRLILATDLEESEIITCNDCLSQLVVESINKKKVILNQAPEIEEDWGE